MIKEMVHAKMKLQSSFIQPCVFQTCITYFLHWNIKRRYYEHCCYCFCPYNKSHWGPKEYLTPLTSMHLCFHKRKSVIQVWNSIRVSKKKSFLDKQSISTHRILSFCWLLKLLSHISQQKMLSKAVLNLFL